MPGARDPAGLHRRARGGRPRRHARRGEAPGRRPAAASTRWCPWTWWSTTRCRWTSSAPRDALQQQRRARVRAQPRALRVPALGPEGVRELPRRAARHRHRAPGEPRVPGQGRADAAARTARTVAFPDTLVGTDSHTTMINGLGVLGWGVGGIEAEAAMLGQPLYMLTPQVVGFKLTGKLREGVTATDLVLTVTQMLRKKGVVEKFVEFYGPGLGADDAWPTAPPSPTWRPSTAPPAASSRSTTRRCATCAAPAAPTDVVDAGRALLQGAGPVPHRRHARPRLHATRWSSTWRRSSRAWPGPSARRTACRSRR